MIKTSSEKQSEHGIGWGLGEEKKKVIWVEPTVGSYTNSSWESLWGSETQWESLAAWQKSF